MRSRLRARQGAQDEDRRGAVQLLRIRRHQRHTGVPTPELTTQPAPMTARAFPHGADLLAACRSEPGLFPFLLESAAHGTPQGRYDILFARPDSEMLVLHADGRLSGPHASAVQGDFFKALDAWWTAERMVQDEAVTDLPFRGGWFLFLGYELAGQVESSLALPRGRDLPIAFAARVPAALIRDRATRSLRYVSESGTDPSMVEALHAALATSKAAHTEPVLATPLREEEPSRYLAQVEQARRYVHDGDIFQANLSRLWSTDLAAGTGAA